MLSHGVIMNDLSLDIFYFLWEVPFSGSFDWLKIDNLLDDVTPLIELGHKIANYHLKEQSLFS